MSTAFVTRRILYGMATSGALLTCFAIVFNLGPFAETPKREAARPVADQSVKSISTSVLLVDAGIRPEQLNTEVSPFPEAFEKQSSFDSPPSVELGATPEPAALPEATIVGVWVPDTSVCSIRAFREGLLPTIINTEGAWAGETFCVFKKRSQTEAGWTLVADCSNSSERWTTHVRLTIKGDRLLWASKRGTQAYTRCAPDFLLAEAR